MQSFFTVTQKLHIILIWTKLKLNGCKLNLISLQIDVRYKMELRFESLEIEPYKSQLLAKLSIMGDNETD